MVIVTVLVVSFGAFLIYANDYYKADSVAIEALNGNEFVEVSYNNEKNYYLFKPTIDTTYAFVFYPGGKVEATAYAPLMLKMAECGVMCILLEVNFNLAIIDQNAADGVQEDFPNITKWTIGGHSLGGTVASIYVSKHPTDYSGIVFLGSYPQKDLSKLDIQSISIYGTEDKIMNQDKFESAKILLPKDNSIIPIEGGNHSQFGSYGHQKGDGDASISPSKQLYTTVLYSLSVILETDSGIDYSC